MTTHTQISFIVSGATFRPSAVDAPFSEREDPGEIGRVGKYRGIPVPFGSATFDVPDNEADGIRHLHGKFAPLMPALRAAGATEFSILITCHGEGQCGVGFDAEELRMLADFGCRVAVDFRGNEVSRTSPAPLDCD